MGTFFTTVGIGDTNGGEIRNVELLVDTGAAHTMLPAPLLRQLNVEPLENVLLSFADGQQAVWPLGMATIACQGRLRQCPVIFCPHEQFLLGATTLEIFNLTVDPVNKQLVPTTLRGRIG